MRSRLCLAVGLVLFLGVAEAANFRIGLSPGSKRIGFSVPDPANQNRSVPVESTGYTVITPPAIGGLMVTFSLLVNGMGVRFTKTYPNFPLAMQDYILLRKYLVDPVSPYNLVSLGFETSGALFTRDLTITSPISVVY